MCTRVSGSGLLGGVQLGYNWQTGPWVFGVQGDFAWAGIKANGADPDIPGLTLTDKIDWVGTASGRIGYAWNTLLLYGKGGAAWVHNKYGGTFPGLGQVTSGSETRTGWLIGGGLEYAFTRNWTAFVEYDYIGLGTHTTTITCINPAFCVGTAQASIKQNLSLAKVGINYKF
jgi:outer membrane immunogenic protein